MAPKSKKSEFPAAFTNFTIKVAERSWEKKVESLLNSVEGVTNFITEGDGKINISGYVEPAVLLKRLRKLGTSAKVMHWQYGECSNNMYVKKKEPATDKNVNVNGHCLYPGYGGYNGHGYPRYGNNYDYNPRIEYAYDYNGHHTGYGNNYGYNRIEYAYDDYNGQHTGYGNNYGYNRIEYAYDDYNGHHTGYGNNYGYNRIEYAYDDYNGQHTGYGNNYGYGYNRIEGAGHASDCNGHHTGYPEKSASRVFKKLSSITSCFNGGV